MPSNLNDTTPAAPSGSLNVKWQTDGGGNDSAYVKPMIGDSGSGGTQGLVPAPPSGSAAAGAYLKADGTFAVPPGTNTNYQTVQQAGSSKTQEPKLNFLAPVTATDNGSNTSTDIAVPTFVASGSGHAAGLVPDPGASAGSTKYLREDATWDVPSGGGSSITLEHNGTNNGSQSILNLKNGSNVTITDDGVGGITIASSGGGGGSSDLPAALSFYGCNPDGGQNGWNGTTFWTRIPGSALIRRASSFKIRCCWNGYGSPATVIINNAVMKRTTPGTYSVIDTTTITFGGGASFPYTININGASTTAPVFADSDTISFSFDEDHDYYFEVYIPFPGGGGNGVAYPATFCSPPAVSGVVTSDITGNTTAPTGMSNSSVTCIAGIYAMS